MPPLLDDERRRAAGGHRGDGTEVHAQSPEREPWTDVARAGHEVRDYDPAMERSMQRMGVRLEAFCGWAAVALVAAACSSPPTEVTERTSGALVSEQGVPSGQRHRCEQDPRQDTAPAPAPPPVVCPGDGIPFSSTSDSFALPLGSGVVCGTVCGGEPQTTTFVLAPSAQQIGLTWSGQVDVSVSVDGGPSRPLVDAIPFVAGGFYAIRVTSTDGAPQRYTLDVEQ
jgi:hypothetical protein